MRSVLVIAMIGSVACASAPTPAAAPAPASPTAAWSEASFDARLAAELHHRFPQATITRAGDDQRYRIASPPPGSTIEVSFAKAHASCQDDWSSCQQAVEWTLRAVGDASQRPALAAAQLRIILRGNAKVAATQANGRHVTARPFSSDAQWLLAADLPTMVRLDIGADELGMTADQAWQTAVANMKKPAAELVTAASEGFIVYQDDYAPSALLDPAALEQAVRGKFPQRSGKLLAACPEENIVLYTLGGAAEVATLRNAIATVATRTMIPLSGEVMEWTGSAWRAAPP
jgi:hypothetical protein